MAYVAVRGGQEAIEASLELLAWEHVKSGRSVAVKDLVAACPDLIDQVMSESSLYAPELAAVALKQADGSPEEAVFLLRAFRSTLERPYVSRTVEPEHMRATRRISAAFKDVPGGQILGATRDYSHRLIDFDLRKEDNESIREARKKMKKAWKEECARDLQDVDAKTEMLIQDNDTATAFGMSVELDGGGAASSTGRLPKVADYLRQQGLLVTYANDDTEPGDVTMEPLVFPAKRSVRLQTLTRGMTQAVNALGYAAIRGFGPAHPTVAELRYGSVDIAVDHPLEADNTNAADAYYVGAIPVTEVESLFETELENPDGTKELSFDLGYGMVMGRGETKAIAMSVLDNCLMQGDKRFPTQDEEFVLYHVDGIEATGFISHLKLPHYVTFQSKLSSVRKTKEQGSDAEQISDTASGKAQESKSQTKGGSDGATL